MKKILLLFFVIFALFSCSHSIDSDLQEEITEEDWIQQRKDAIIDYIIFDNYEASEDDVLADAERMLCAISNANEENSDKEITSFKSKSLGSSAPRFEKTQNSKEYTPKMSFDVSAFKSKSASSDTDSIVLSEYKIYNEDGTVQFCVTSNDRRVGTVLCISDPYNPEDLDENLTMLDNPSVQSSVESSINIIESITQEDLDAVTGGNASFKSKKKYIWDDGTNYRYEIKSMYYNNIPKLEYDRDKYDRSTTEYRFIFDQAMTLASLMCYNKSFKYSSTSASKGQYYCEDIMKNCVGFDKIYQKYSVANLHPYNFYYNYFSYLFSSIKDYLKTYHGYSAAISNRYDDKTYCILQYLLKGKPMLCFNGISLKILNGRYTEVIKYDVWRFWIKKTKSETRTYYHYQDGFGNGEWTLNPVIHIHFAKANPPKK